MTLLPPATFIQLEELACAEQENSDELNDDVCIDSPAAEILSPSSKWSVLINISVLSCKSAQALKKCGHSLQILTYDNTDISLFCHLCNFSDIEKLTVNNENLGKVKEKHCLEVELGINDPQVVINESDNVEFQAESLSQNETVQETEVISCETEVDLTSSDNWKTKEDETISLAEMPSVLDKEIEVDASLKKAGPVLLFDTRFEGVETKSEILGDILADMPLDLLYPDVKLKEDESEVVKSEISMDTEITILRIKPLSELQNKIPDLPSYKSQEMSDSLNPMTNIPTYVLDDSIVEEEGFQPQVIPTVSKRVYKVMNSNISHQIPKTPQNQQGKFYHPQQNYILNSFGQSPTSPASVHSTSPQMSFQSPQFQAQTLPSQDFAPYQTSPLQQRQYHQQSPQRHPSAGYSPQTIYPNMKTYQKMRSSPMSSPSPRVNSPSTAQRLSAQNQMSIDSLVMQKSQLFQTQNQYLYQNFSPKNPSFPQTQDSVQKSLYSRIQQFQSNSSPTHHGAAQVNRPSYFPMSTTNPSTRIQNPNPALHALNSSSISVNVVQSAPKQVMPGIRSSPSPDIHRSPLPLYHDPRLPPGWQRSVHRTEQGQYAVLLTDPQGRKFRSKEDVRRYLEGRTVSNIDPENMDFSVFGKVSMN